MRDLPLIALRAFAAVYAHRGIRAAARELGVAHSSVSRHLVELSRWLGAPLVQETAGRRALSFTSQGEALGKATLAGLGEIARALEGVREARSSRGVVLATTHSFAARWLVPRLPMLEQAHPGIEISVVSDQRMSDLEGSGIDLAIRMGRGPWANEHCEPLMDDRLYPVMSPGFWKDAGKPASPEDLVGLRLLHDRDPQASWKAWRDSWGPDHLDVRRGPRLASSDLVLQGAIQGQGVALARHRLASHDVDSGTLVRPIGALAVEVGTSYWIVVSRPLRIRGPIARVVSWLREAAASPEA